MRNRRSLYSQHANNPTGLPRRRLCSIQSATPGCCSLCYQHNGSKFGANYVDELVACAEDSQKITAKKSGRLAILCSTILIYFRPLARSQKPRIEQTSLPTHFSPHTDRISLHPFAKAFPVTLNTHSSDNYTSHRIATHCRTCT